MQRPRNSSVHFRAGAGTTVLLLVVLLLPATARAGSGRAASSWSGAGTTGRSKGLDAMEGDWGSAPSSAPKFGTGASKSSQGGYSAQRVQRFWSHYHGNRREAKSKPLERTH